jgi:nucleotide-binding universal stress UspA family protein
VNSAFTRLLLATEHTEFDVGAERVAFELARQRGVPLAAVLPFVSNVEYETVAPEAVARAEKDVFARITQLQGVAQAAGVAFDIRVRRGEEPYREIIAEAQARSADLIIARRRGKRGFFANLMVGEMVGKVATHAPCSVLLVPRAGRVWTRRVLAAVDGTRATASVAATAARIAVEAGVPLVVVSVAVRDTPDGRAVAQAAVAAAASTAQALGATVDGRVVAGPAAETIAALATESGADLIVAGRGGPSSHGRFHLGGNAHRIIGIASCPVLVVKP